MKHLADFSRGDSRLCRHALTHQEAPSEVQHLLIPEEVGIRVAAELATGSSNGLGGGRCVLRQIWGNDIACLNQICQSICAGILHKLHAKTEPSLAGGMNARASEHGEAIACIKERRPLLH